MRPLNTAYFEHCGEMIDPPALVYENEAEYLRGVALANKKKYADFHCPRGDKFAATARRLRWQAGVNRSSVASTRARL